MYGIHVFLPSGTNFWIRFNLDGICSQAPSLAAGMKDKTFAEVISFYESRFARIDTQGLY